jgi:ATP-dependent DNA helicase RecG
MSYSFLDNGVEYIKGVGPKRAELLQKELNIFTYGDLLCYYPFRYIDRSKFLKINEVKSDAAYVQLKGHIRDFQIIGSGNSARMTATLNDDTGEMELVWFKGFKWLKDRYTYNNEYIVFGKPSLFNGKFNIVHPEIDDPAEDKMSFTEGLQPFYNTTEKLKNRGFTSRGIAKIIKLVLGNAKGIIHETLPEEIINRLKLISREESLFNIHFPSDTQILKKAQSRLKFEELFFIQLTVLKQKNVRIIKKKGHVFSVIGNYFNDFYHKNLPFELTNAQKKVIKEIRADVGSGKQMNRLLQGDVGSGKTLVALMTMLMALDNHCQACLMAPTEILANQHYKTITRFLTGLDISVELLTGSTKKSQRKIIQDNLESGNLKILIGTHALIEENVKFANLGMVIIDEQHRFGVAQRAKMWEKNAIAPHVLVMTATPIPRTLAMTIYGDLDYSVIDEMPPGRKAVKTYHFYENDSPKIINFLKQQIAEGRQIYVVYPLINESETLDLKHLMEGYDVIVNEFPPPKYAVSMVHGQMKTTEKDREMKRFADGETQIMVATTVIEVGVDVPNASVMIIENAERFGLSQLHQLRGRVGRGAEQSHCILVTGYKLTAIGRKRIETMVRTSDGFEIAEMDLKLRGPGDMEGTQQSGILDLKIADIIKDEKILKFAHQLVLEILNDDPLLEKEKNSLLAYQLKLHQQKNKNWGLIS